MTEETFVEHPPYEKSEREQKINALCDIISTAEQHLPPAEAKLAIKAARVDLLTLIEGQVGHKETPVEEYFVSRMAAVGGCTRKVKWVGRRGAPDRRAMHKKGRAWVEVKPDGEPLEDHQKREHKRMRGKGEVVVTVTGKAGVDRFIVELLRGDYVAG